MNYCKKKIKKSNSDLEESLSISENNMILLTEKKKKWNILGYTKKNGLLNEKQLITLRWTREQDKWAKWENLKKVMYR